MKTKLIHRLFNVSNKILLDYFNKTTENSEISKIMYEFSIKTHGLSSKLRRNEFIKFNISDTEKIVFESNDFTVDTVVNKTETSYCSYTPHRYYVNGLISSQRIILKSLLKYIKIKFGITNNYIKYNGNYLVFYNDYVLEIRMNNTKAVSFSITLKENYLMSIGLEPSGIIV